MMRVVVVCVVVVCIMIVLYAPCIIHAVCVICMCICYPPPPVVSANADTKGGRNFITEVLVLHVGDNVCGGHRTANVDSRFLGLSPLPQAMVWYDTLDQYGSHAALLLR